MLEVLLKRIRANDATLTQIDLQKNNIGAAGAKALAEALKQNKTVTQISLAGNQIGDQGVKALAEALKENKTVTQINLGNNKIGAEGAQALAEALKQNRTVTRIDLYANKIDAQGAQALAEALKQNQTVMQINLGNNQIGAEGAQALAEALKINQTLTQIDLSGNGIDDANQEAINEALKTNKDRIKTTRNQTLLTLLILLRHAHSSQRNLPLEVWELIINLFDFPSVSKGYRASCAVASFLKQEAVFTEFNQRLQSGENVRLVETCDPKIGESRFSFLASRPMMTQATVIPAEHSESLTKRPE